MTKFAAIVRRVMLSVFMLFFLIAFVTKTESNTTLGAITYMGMLISMGVYLLFSITSIILRLIRRKRMGEHEATLTAYTDTLLFVGNSNTINYFRRIAFWGSIMLAVNVFALRVPSYMIVGGPYSSDAFLKGYHGFLLWAIISLVFMFIVSLLYFAFYLPHYGTGAYNVLQYAGKLLLSDLTTPFRVIKSIFPKKDGRKRTTAQIVGMVTMLVFTVVNVIAIIKTV